MEDDQQDILATIYVLNVLGHWFFATQYLKTSLVMPRLMIEAKLEWVLEDAKTNASLMQTASMDTNRLREALNQSGVDISAVGESLYETISKIDEVIHETHKHVRKVGMIITMVNAALTFVVLAFLIVQISAIDMMSLD